MYVRCPNCRHNTRSSPGVIDRPLTCTTCGRRMSLRRIAELGRTPHERYHRALEFAKGRQIDLASAYSVLLGLVPLEQARHCEDLNTERRPGDYDRGFERAIAEGFLTLRQARERGDRVAYATRVATRHELPMELAFDVADNRMNVPQAVQYGQQRAQVEIEVRERGNSKRNGLWDVAAIVLIVSALTILGFRQFRNSDGRDEPVPPVERLTQPLRREIPRVVVGSSVRRNPKGQVVEASAPNPRAALDAFVGALPGEASLLDARPSPDEWRGVVRDGRVLRGLSARPDDASGSWTARWEADSVASTD